MVPGRILECPETAEAPTTKTLMANPRAAAAAATMPNTLEPVAMVHTPMNISHNGTSVEMISGDMGYLMASRLVILFTMIRNQDPYIHDSVY